MVSYHYLCPQFLCRRYSASKRTVEFCCIVSDEKSLAQRVSFSGTLKFLENILPTTSALVEIKGIVR